MTVTVVQQQDRMARISVNDIRESKEALRTVDRKNPEYVMLADSVRLSGGPKTPIRVREMTDAETGETFYGLIDGLQRWTATKDAGIDFIDAKIVSSDDFQVLLDQTILNACRVETLPAEYSKQLQRILQACPTMTSSDLATRLSRSESWIKERLRLTNLTPEAAKLLDSGAINLINGYSLAKLPVDEQESYLEQAQTMATSEFTNLVIARCSAIQKAKRAGGTDSAPVFTHKPYLRKPAEIVIEAENCEVGKAYIAENRITSPEEAWKAALDWAATNDPKSIATAKAKWDEMEKARQEKKEKAAIERERRKVGVADIKARRAKLEMSLAEQGASAEDKAEALKAFDAAPENQPPAQPAKTVAAAE